MKSQHLQAWPSFGWNKLLLLLLLLLFSHIFMIFFGIRFIIIPPSLLPCLLELPITEQIATTIVNYFSSVYKNIKYRNHSLAPMDALTNGHLIWWPFEPHAYKSNITKVGIICTCAWFNMCRKIWSRNINNRLQNIYRIIHCYCPVSALTGGRLIELCFS